MLQELIEPAWLDAFESVLRRCALKPGDTVAILAESQSRPVLVELARLAAARIGAQVFTLVLPSVLAGAQPVTRSTGASGAIRNLAPVVSALAASTLVVDCTVEGLMHAPELPAILKGANGTLVRTASEEGISLLPIVHYAPTWALVNARKRDDVYELAPHEDAYADYARFLLACIRRYGPGGQATGTIKPFTPITHWQVWNEPNLKQFWGPDPDAEDFAKFTRVVHQTLAPVRNKVKLVHAGLSKSDIEFMWHLWDADPKHGETFDIMAVHSYVFDGNDGIRAPDAMDKDSSDAGPMGFVGSTKDAGYLGKVFNLQLFMTLRGSPGKPIWITEMGYFVARHRLGVTEPEQGTRLQQTVDFIRRRLTDQPYGSTGPRKLPANVQRLYWFSLEDYPSPEGLGTFGVYRPDGSLRPAGAALKALTKP